MSMRELAARLGGHASNATGIADRLAARGLVKRHEDADDRRVKRVGLTTEGVEPKTDLREAQRQAARLLGSIELD